MIEYLFVTSKRFKLNVESWEVFLHRGKYTIHIKSFWGGNGMRLWVYAERELPIREIIWGCGNTDPGVWYSHVIPKRDCIGRRISITLTEGEVLKEDLI